MNSGATLKKNPPTDHPAPAASKHRRRSFLTVHARITPDGHALDKPSQQRPLLFQKRHQGVQDNAHPVRTTCGFVIKNPRLHLIERFRKNPSQVCAGIPHGTKQRTDTTTLFDNHTRGVRVFHACRWAIRIGELLNPPKGFCVQQGGTISNKWMVAQPLGRVGASVLRKVVL